jgi:hypothetical protein
MSSYYGLNTTCTDPSNAGKLTSTGGGSTTADTTGTETFNYGGYIQLLFLGGVSTVAGGVQSPNGRGFGLDSSELNGQSVPAGDWSVQVPLINSNASATVDVTARLFKRTPGGATYTEIGEATLSGQTIGTSLTVLNFTITAAQADFAADEFLYLDVWYHLTAGGSGTNLTSYRVSGDANGNPSALSVTTPSSGSPQHLDGEIDHTNAVSGTLSVSHHLTGEADDTSTLSGTLTVSHHLSGEIDDTAFLSGSLESAESPGTATLAVTATNTATMAVTATNTATLSVSHTATATLGVTP